MKRFAAPAVPPYTWGAALGIIAVTVAVLLGIDRADLLTQIATLKQANTELTTQNRGVQGADGDPGRAPTAAEIAAAVEAYCAERDECRGVQGIAGATGQTGDTGSTGAAGVSVGSVKCNGTSISFYSTTGQLLGNVKLVCIP